MASLTSAYDCFRRRRQLFPWLRSRSINSGLALFVCAQVPPSSVLHIHTIKHSIDFIYYNTNNYIYTILLNSSSKNHFIVQTLPNFTVNFIITLSTNCRKYHSTNIHCNGGQEAVVDAVGVSGGRLVGIIVACTPCTPQGRLCRLGGLLITNQTSNLRLGSPQNQTQPSCYYAVLLPRSLSL